MISFVSLYFCMQFYTVSNLHIDGLCVCNGYADSCTVDHVTGLYQCNCSNGTCGQHCEQCCPLFNNAPYIGYGTGCDGKSVVYLYVTAVWITDLIMDILQWYGYRLTDSTSFLSPLSI